jgi:potassium efflux system protein
VASSTDTAYEEVRTGVLRTLTWERGLLAAGIAIAFLLAAKLGGYLLRRMLARRNIDLVGPVFAWSKLATYTLIAAGFVAALGIVGVPLGSLLVPSIVVLVGAGLGLQGLFKDVVASIVILVEQRIRAGDLVTYGETTGTVKEIGLRATQLLTRDGTVLVVPNNVLMGSEVSNHTHPFRHTRLSVEVPVSLREDVDAVSDALLEAGRQHPSVRLDPPVAVRLLGITESCFRFSLVVWVDDAPAAVRLSSELRLAIAHVFAERNIQFPTPELTLHAIARDDAGAPAGGGNGGSLPH